MVCKKESPKLAKGEILRECLNKIGVASDLVLDLHFKRGVVLIFGYLIFTAALLVAATTLAI